MRQQTELDFRKLEIRQKTAQDSFHNVKAKVEDEEGFIGVKGKKAQQQEKQEKAEIRKEVSIDFSAEIVLPEDNQSLERRFEKSKIIYSKRVSQASSDSKEDKVGDSFVKSTNTSNSGKALFDNQDDYPWHEYYTSAMKDILKLRLKSVNVDSIPMVDTFVFDGTADSAEKIAKHISKEAYNKLLVTLNLYNKHWVGIVIDKSDYEIQLTYMDSEQVTMPEILKQKVIDTFAEVNPEYRASITEAELEKQKYSNCGLEVIENFVAYLTGNRLPQEEASAIHSILFEDMLLGHPEDMAALLGYAD